MRELRRMRSRAFALAGTLLCVQGICAAASPGTATIPPAKVIRPPVGASKVVVLWPKGAPGAVGNEDADIPKLYVYPASGEKAHSAVIVFPGGGYSNLATEKEGASEARWLNQHGVTAFVLTYRLGPRYGYPLPMKDGARAVRYVRSHAEEFKVAKDRIGLWGFSAGGHLAAYLATMHDGGEKNAADPIDRASDRPDFAILSYARLTLDPSIPRKTSLEALIGRNPTPALVDAVSLDRHVTKDTPPCFLFTTTGDPQVDSRNSTAFYDALRRAGVQAELHIFERGGHGLGMAEKLVKIPELGIYTTLLANWMEMHGWMPPGEAEASSESKMARR